ncbi:MAG: penicillin-binding protein activator LpoB [Spirochaetia bacterium]|nr:penicillin-binding protein activator LpoB [Spirochaetia bacterium]
MMKKPVTLLLGMFVFSHCASTQYADSRKDTGSRQWGAREINETVDTMVASLYSSLKDMKHNVLISVSKIRNRTSEHIDTTMIADEISTRLIKRGIPFIDKSQRTETLKEIEFGQTGAADSENAISAGQLKSPNYELIGEVTDSVSYEGNNRKQFIIVTLKLIEVETTSVVWQERQEFMKVSKEEKYGW